MATSKYIPEKGVSSAVAAQMPVVMPGRRRQFLNASMLAPFPIVINDILAILIAFAAAFILRAIFIDKMVHYFGLRSQVGIVPVSILCVAWFALVYVLVARRYGLYGHVLNAGGAHELRMAVQACLTAGMLLCGALYILHDQTISRAFVILLTASAMVAIGIRRASWRRRRYRQYERGLSTRHIAILGTNHLSYAMGQLIVNEPRMGFTLHGYILAPDYASVAGSDVLGGIGDIRQIARRHFLDEVVITERFPLASVVQLIKDARELGIDVRAVLGYYNELTTDSSPEFLGGFPLISLHRSASRVFSLAMKRTADFVLSLAALIMVTPILVAVAIAIRLEGPGPIFYVSERIGRRGRVFPCFKFRTMVPNAEQLKKDMAALNERDGILFKVSNDPRITRVGRILRKYSLDELPQFFNVLRGEMSLVGPRPPIASEVEKYELEHLRRLEVLPGITGLWQVQARQDASFEKYIALDTAYVENWGFWLDLKILFWTVDVVIRGTGT
jgi:exopolysaccharide biosynthesis polyprenyl glycosylphosphotransferase